jgi:dihydrofolate reductase
MIDAGRCAMRKVIVWNLVSLDGYYEGPGGDVMVLPLDGSFDAYSAERLRAADILLLGRRTYEQFRGFWPSVADHHEATKAQIDVSRRMNEMKKAVVSDSLSVDANAPWSDNTEIMRRADAHDRIAELKAGPGGDIVVAGSHILWNDLLAHGLVDELHLMIGAVVLGAGTPAFERKPEVHLRLVDVHKLDGSENLITRYEVTANDEAVASEQVSVGVTPDSLRR